MDLSKKVEEITTTVIVISGSELTDLLVAHFNLEDSETSINFDADQDIVDRVVITHEHKELKEK